MEAYNVRCKDCGMIGLTIGWIEECPDCGGGMEHLSHEEYERISEQEELCN